MLNNLEMTRSSGGRMKRVVLSGAISLCLLSLTVLALRWGVADAGVQHANDALARWGATPANLQSWQAARDSLNASRGLEPQSPAVLEALGLLHAQRVTDANATQAFHEQALGFFRQAAVLRPVSAYTWASLASTKYQLNEIDAELRAALTNAVMLGPWEPEVQFVVADVGFSLWDELPEESRGEVLKVAVNAMARYSAKLLHIAEKRGRLGLLCQSDMQLPESALGKLNCPTASPS